MNATLTISNLSLNLNLILCAIYLDIEEMKDHVLLLLTCKLFSVT